MAKRDGIPAVLFRLRRNRNALISCAWGRLPEAEIAHQFIAIACIFMVFLRALRYNTV
jgi:hypothetical protein